MPDEISHQLLQALRAVVRNPGFAAAVIISLALGIAVNAAVFSLLAAVLLRPFPVRAPEQLLALYTTPVSGGWSSTSYPDYLDYRQRADIFSGLMGYVREPMSFNSGGRTERFWAEMVTWNYFPVLGIRPSFGRGFLPQDETAADVAVISHALWQRHFGGDPRVLGRKVRINGNPFEIIGIAPQGFQGVTLDWGLPPDIWVPITVMDQQRTTWWHLQPLLPLRDARMLLVVGRLQPGVAIAQAETALRLTASRLASAYADSNRNLTVSLLPGSQARFWPEYRSQIVLYLGLLTAVSGLVMLLACVNVSTLLVARCLTRSHETSVRLALGASPAVLLRGQTIEAGLYSFLGLGIGLALARAALVVFRMFPLPFEIGLSLGIAIDRRTILAAAAIAGATTLFLGLATTLQTRRLDLRSAIQARDGVSRGSNRLRGVLVVVEIALSVILVAGAGLFLKALHRSLSIDPGFKPENVLILSVDFNTMDYRYDEAKGLAFYRRVLEHISVLPGVRAVTWGGDVPLALRHLIIYFTSDARAQPSDSDWIRIDCNVVGPDYFQTLGIPIVKGRDFRIKDDEASSGVVVINETMARRYWPQEDPVGKWIKLKGRPRELYQIVGISRDVRQRSLWDAAAPYLYVPVLQRYFPEMMLHVRTEGNPMAMLPEIRREIEAIDRDLPIFDERPLQAQIDAATAQQRAASLFLSAAGGLSLILAGVGVYGVLSYWVLQRRQDIGIRLSLGAQRGGIAGLVLREGFALIGCGLVLGLAAVLWLSRFIRSLLHGVKPADPVILLCSALFLGLVCLPACLIPSLRATRLDPMSILRRE